MSDLLGKTRQLQVVADSSTEIVLESGEKLQYNVTQRVSFARPNMLRAARQGPLGDLVFLYDGDRFVVFGKKTNTYAIAPAPKDFEQAIDDARARLGLDAPGADLLLPNSYAALMDGVQEGKYLGGDVIDGVACHHLAYRNVDVDWQIWIDDGDKPLPRKFLVTTKTVKGHPEFIATFSNWQLDPKFGPAEFAFQPPPGAQRVEFLPPDPIPGGASPRQGGNR